MCNAHYPVRLGPSSGKLVENCTKLIFLEITGYRIKYSTVLWLLELQIRRGLKLQTQVHTVNSKNRTSNCQCSLFSQKNPIIRIFCISGCFAVPINPDKCSYTVCEGVRCRLLLYKSYKQFFFHFIVSPCIFHLQSVNISN
jgi:hypothetical protein